MKILVLGSRSFYGGWFMDVARAAGHQVRGLARPEWDLRSATSAQMVRDLVSVGYRHVVNFAALNVVAPSWEKAPDYYETNVAGMARLGKALLETTALERFVEVSTPEVYGTTGMPIAESGSVVTTSGEISDAAAKRLKGQFAAAFPAGFRLDTGLSFEPFTMRPLVEGPIFNPSTPYAISRAAASWHLSLLHREFGLPVCITRTVNIYGERQQPFRIIPRTIYCALSGAKLPLEGGGQSTRSFLHAEDAALATLAVLERGRSGETYHIAHPTQVRIVELVTAICKTLSVHPDKVIEEVPERAGKDMNYQLDDSKIRRELRWSERIKLSDGLARTIEWFKFRELAAEMAE